ncbi:MAG: TetR/AcrR family transcriptional regulator [Deltaproteobacteria bacterium]|nr:TetR/AcrR family transcriptional regulator [Deltaproteobacteria bacterium]
MSNLEIPAVLSDKKELGRLQILEVAVEVIAERGFHAMSMRELSKAVGRSLAGFYNYFSCKEELLLAIQTRALNTLLASAKEAVSGIEDPAASLYAFIYSHVCYVANHHAAMQVLVQEASALDEQRRGKVRQVKEDYFQLARTQVENVVNNGCWARPGRPDVDEVELERLTYSLFGMLNWTYGWYRPEQHGSPRELAQSIKSMAVCGMASSASSCAHSKACEEVDDHFAGLKLLPIFSLDKRRNKTS